MQLVRERGRRRGEPPNWAVLTALYHPEHVFESDMEASQHGLPRSDRVPAFLDDQNETWDDWRHDLDGVIDAGGNE